LSQKSKIELNFIRSVTRNAWTTGLPSLWLNELVSFLSFLFARELWDTQPTMGPLPDLVTRYNINQPGWQVTLWEMAAMANDLLVLLNLLSPTRADFGYM